MNQFAQLRKSTAYSKVPIPERQSHQESKLAQERKAYILKSKFQWQGMTPWDTLSTNFLISAFSSWSHLPGPLPSTLQGWMALSVLNDSAQCSAKEIPSFSSWLTRKLKGSQLFSRGDMTDHRERRRLSLTVGTPLWLANACMVGCTPGRRQPWQQEGLVGTCVFALWRWTITTHFPSPDEQNV